jgi:hypothetical protein
MASQEGGIRGTVSQKYNGLALFMSQEASDDQYFCYLPASFVDCALGRTQAFSRSFHMLSDHQNKPKKRS